MKKPAFTHILEYFRDKDWKWRFHIKASNKKIIVSSEAYANITMCRRSATRMIDSVKNKTMDAVVTKRKRNK